MEIFKILLYQPLLKGLIFLTGMFAGSFGVAIIVFTFLIRAILIPLSLPAMKSAKKMKDLKPHLDEIKKRFGNDKKRVQMEQLNLYKEHGINPAAGCIPTLVQFAVLIAIYQVFIDFIGKGAVDSHTVNMSFLWMDLSKPDQWYILPIFAGVSQLALSQMLMAGKEHHEQKDLKPAVVSEEKSKSAPTKQEGTQEMAEAIQQQMLYVMPVMTALIALRLPSGLAVYWVATTVFSIIQQYVVSGPGGLATVVDRLKGGIRHG
ncbi:MAG: hypothetical protein A3F04_00835 [Candidatus Chisholmbacteria bacterium RIFCSPHIGHO2_12_FULL_49_9]|uniref:Membrane insertase YidC/Oxa/ALB C-terminal domain-containing protein n=1 Tax=Candidatus Chisholmbacteria bacterium RIFCSPHIGHO2_01_FULL_52_32 TaxID=1797591 RepID=A0A1G1VUK4_9BACT|nr:MAG: hypothetical protein A2786_06045 [Candidatus Chisholmbacteria bacterium RIFCSPHIGHO2_01_FULL_52_32]OGY19417.1 MAG: hypothetical protein A3F04_00835 [Candidatus Chisholmbacteria bacterium RIFCSPHIGHO2_12_FULL_49_9]OGY19664.1 MAG: hypothetical protein A2900_00985 [Candidatus Chisholmbacteria bacterium RIFCSPLOWO2_01_FULL_50_28]